jgi:HAMP domain-containing protein
MFKNLKLRLRFTIIMIIVYILSLPFMIYGSYYILKQNAVREILEESNLMLAAMEGARKYTGEVLRPRISKELPDKFIIEAMSATFVARGIEKRIREKLPNYAFKEATLNPLNLEYKADNFEEAKIEEFKSGKLEKEWRGYKKTGTGNFYVIMRPVEIKPDCIRCHGDPLQAPPEVREQFGTTHGYGWKAGEIQTVNTIYVPADVPIENAKKALILFTLLYSVFFFAVIIIIDRAIKASIIKPIEEFVNVAEDISRGKFEREFAVKTDDEIKTLASAFTRMKLSLEKAMDIMRRK